MRTLLLASLAALGCAAGAESQPHEGGLVAAAFGGKTETVKTLLDRRASVEARCVDTDNGAGDKDGDDCEDYAINTDSCPESKDDDEDFSARKMCCACSGGAEAQDDQGLTALMAAAASGRKETAELLLERRASVAAQDNQGNTSLTLAVRWGHGETADLLLEHGAALPSQGRGGWLHAAASAGATKVVEELLDHDALLDCRAALDEKNEDGDTALIQAANNGHKEVAEALLKHRAAPDEKNKDGVTALMRAAWLGHKEVAEALLDHHAAADEKSRDGKTALMWAAYKGHEEVAEALLKHRAAPDEKDKNGETALMQTPWFGHKEVAEALLKHRAAPDEKNKRGETALVRAAWLGRKEVAEALLEHRAAPDEKDRYGLSSLLAAASAQGGKELVELLLAHRAAINARNQRGSTALMLTLNRRSSDIRKVAEVLLEHKAAVNLQRLDGATALTLAAKRGHKDMVALLLERKSLLQPTAQGKTALTYAIEHDFKGIVHMLRATIASEPARGRTDLMRALQYGDTEKVDSLLERRALHLESRSADGKTALMYAAMCGSRTFVRKLISGRANPVARDPAGLQASDFALSEQHFDLLPLLRQPGLESRYRRIWGAPQFTLLIVACATITVAYATITSKQGGMQLLRNTDPFLPEENIITERTRRPSRGAITLAAQALSPACRRYAASAYRMAEVFSNTVVPMHLMLAVHPCVWLLAMFLAYVLPELVTPCKARLREPYALALTSVRPSLLRHVSVWTRGARCFCALGMVRTAVLLCLYLWAVKHAGENSSWYNNVNGREVTKLLQGNSLHAICTGLPLPSFLPKPWINASGTCSVEARNCISSPGYPRSSGGSSSCRIKVQFPWSHFSTLNAEQFMTSGHNSLHMNGALFMGHVAGMINNSEIFPGMEISWDAGTPDGASAWKLCMNGELCIPTLAVNDLWRLSLLCGEIMLGSWLVLTIALLVLSLIAKNDPGTRRATVRELALMVDRACEEVDGARQEDGIEHRHLEALPVEVKPATMMTFDVGMLVLDMVLDLNTANTFLLNADYWFAFFTLTAMSASTAVELQKGWVRAVWRDIHWMRKSGVQTDAFLDFLDQERGTEALVSLLVSSYGLPFAAKTPFTMITGALSVMVSVYGVAMLVHQKLDLEGFAEEGEEDQGEKTEVVYAATAAAASASQQQEADEERPSVPDAGLRLEPLAE